MAKIWDPAAKRETVSEFVSAWCEVGQARWSREEVMFGAYETYCRCNRRRDLTLGQFNHEMELLGHHQEPRHGTMMWKGIGLAVMEDGMVQRRYGAGSGL